LGGGEGGGKKKANLEGKKRAKNANFRAEDAIPIAGRVKEKSDGSSPEKKRKKMGTKGGLCVRPQEDSTSQILLSALRKGKAGCGIHFPKKRRYQLSLSPFHKR